jgi:ethanolamine utilization protein EutJ
MTDDSANMRPADLLAASARALTRTGEVRPDEPLRLGVDLGTASVILVALGESGLPVASEMEPCEVARDGLVVDYMGAIAVTKRLLKRLNERLDRELTTAAIAVPPGTNPADAATHRHVVQAAELEVTAVLDEPSAANAVLGIRNGAVVDIGGGTTGLAILKDGEVRYVADEATGGHHMSLVLMGRYGLTYAEAEAMKLDPERAAEVAQAVGPVAQKMASIVARHVADWDVEKIYLVGGASSLLGIEDVFSSYIGIPTKKPPHPMMVTPLGIAMNCTPG